MSLSQQRPSTYYRNKRRKEGLCPTCGKPLDRDGYYCSSCLEKQRIYHQRNRDFFRENHLCTVCGKNKVPNGERTCPECRAKKMLWENPRTKEQLENFKTNQRMLYKERTETGICTRCGKRKTVPGKKKCAICLERDAKIHRKKYIEKPDIRKYRVENHLCFFCGVPLDMPTGKICSKCFEKFSQNGKRNSKKNSYWKEQNDLIFKR